MRREGTFKGPSTSSCKTTSLVGTLLDVRQTGASFWGKPIFVADPFEKKQQGRALEKPWAPAHWSYSVPGTQPPRSPD